MVAWGIGVQTTKADTTKAVTGWAWSSNIGWIKFNPGSSDDVKYNLGTGALSGYAWSSNIGWIHFAPTGGYPESPTTGAKLPPADANNPNGADGPMTGWAKALAGSSSGGWDGWIKMSGGWTNGVHRDGNSLTGYAWGSEVVGWVNFNPAINAANDCDPVTSGIQTVCIEDGGGGLDVACSVVPPFSQEVNESVTWAASASGGTSPYGYSWSWTDGSSGSGQSVSKTYFSPGSITGTVTANDDTNPIHLTGTCSQTIHICPVDESWDPATSACTVDNGGSGGSGTLELQSNSSYTAISLQSTAPATSKPTLEIKNNSEGLAAGPVNHIRINSIIPSFPTGIAGLTFECRLSTTIGGTDWYPCLTTDFGSLDVGSSLYFAVKVSQFDQSINPHSPFKIKIIGDNNVVLTKNETPTDIIFEYLVSGTNPR